MARRKPQAQVTGGPIPKRMHLPKDVAIDPTTLTLPEPALKAWFADEAAVAQFSVPVRPR
jgi:hypothetical protein